MNNPANTVHRREFLRRTAAGAAAIALAGAAPTPASESDALPTRALGRTKANVTILGLGTAPIGEARLEIPTAVKIFGEVMDRGVNYIDTARIYGIAEQALGQLVPQRRDKLFLVTKVWTDSADAAEKAFSESLRTMKVDHVDLVHIHNAGDKNPDKVLGKDGVLQYLLKQKQAGKLRFIGMSGHCKPNAFLRILETDQIDVVMPVMNYADRNIYNFEEKVLPECRKRNVGVVAMKVYAGIKGGFPNHRKGSVGCNTKPELLPLALAYALDLQGVSSAIVGPFTLEQALQNIQFAKQYKPLTPQQRQTILAEGQTLASTLGPRYGPVA